MVTWARQTSHHDCCLLLALQADDRVTSPVGSQRMHDVAAVKDKTIWLVEGAWHAEIFAGVRNGDSQRKAFQYVADWLGART